MIRSLSPLLLAAVPLLAQKPAPFEVEEATIFQIHDAMKAGRLTCRALVGQYLKRIDAYDKNGPAINAIVLVNPDIIKQADELDRRFSQSGLTGPLHCVPMIVKDNLHQLSQSRTASLREVQRARILCRYHAGETITAIARANGDHAQKRPKVD